MDLSASLTTSLDFTADVDELREFEALEARVKVRLQILSQLCFCPSPTFTCLCHSSLLALQTQQSSPSGPLGFLLQKKQNPLADTAALKKGSSVLASLGSIDFADFSTRPKASSAAGAAKERNGEEDHEDEEYDDDFEDMGTQGPPRPYASATMTHRGYDIGDARASGQYTQGGREEEEEEEEDEGGMGMLPQRHQPPPPSSRPPPAAFSQTTGIRPPSANAPSQRQPAMRSSYAGANRYSDDYSEYRSHDGGPRAGYSHEDHGGSAGPGFGKVPGHDAPPHQPSPPVAATQQHSYGRDSYDRGSLGEADRAVQRVEDQQKRAGSAGTENRGRATSPDANTQGRCGCM